MKSSLEVNFEDVFCISLSLHFLQESCRDLLFGQEIHHADAQCLAFYFAGALRIRSRFIRRKSASPAIATLFLAVSTLELI